MDESAVKRIVVDVCRRCQFAWFDRLEFEQLEQARRPQARAFVYLESEYEAEKIQSLEERVDYYKEHVEDLKEELNQVRNESQVSIPDNWRKFPFLLGVPVQMSGGLSRVPILSYLIAAAIAGLSLVNLIDVETAKALYGFLPGEALRFAGVTLLSYVIVHPNLVALAVNAYLLVLFGDDLEDLVGRPRFAAITLLSILAGALGHGYFYSWGGPLLLGLEPAICALMVAYTLRLPYARMGAILPLPFLAPYINTPAWMFTLIWFLLYLPGYFWFGAAHASVPALAAGALSGAVAYLVLVRDR